MATVKVMLDPTMRPAVTLDPDPLDIDCHGETIHWVPADSTSTFTFVALVFNKENPFCNVVVTQKEITARDSNQCRQDHNYHIWVTDNGKYYSSEGGLTGGGPTIRNN